MSTAFMFPGQGSQYVGMGKELADNFPSARKIFDRAAERLGREYVDVIFNGPEEKLRQTRFTQPALFIVSMAAFDVLNNSPWRAAFAAGHSLGEYSALCAAAAFDFDTGLDLVKARGEAIQEASEKIPGTMAAIVGLETPQVEEICRTAAAKGICEPVNFNCPGQIVIAGAVAAVEEAVRLAQAAGGAKSHRLNVSGPFHSSLMRSAAERMASMLEKAPIRDTIMPVFANCDADPTRTAIEIRKKLVRQIDHPVLWDRTLSGLIAKGVHQFVEVGPGRVLCGLLRHVDKNKKFFNIEDKRSADALLGVRGQGSAKARHFPDPGPTQQQQ